MLAAIQVTALKVHVETETIQIIHTSIGHYTHQQDITHIGHYTHPLAIIQINRTLHSFIGDYTLIHIYWI